MTSVVIHVKDLVVARLLSSLSSTLILFSPSDSRACHNLPASTPSPISKQSLHSLNLSETVLDEVADLGNPISEDPHSAFLQLI